MNSGQYHFLISGRCQTLYFLQNILNISASHPSSGIRNNAVTAELVTTILYFYKRAGMLCCMIQCQLLKCLFFVVNIHHSLHLFSSARKESIQPLYQFFFLIISDQNINCFITFCLILFGLYIASGSNNSRIRIQLFCPVQHLS